MDMSNTLWVQFLPYLPSREIALIIMAIVMPIGFYHAYRMYMFSMLFEKGTRVMATITFITTDIKYHIGSMLMRNWVAYSNSNTPPVVSYRITYKFVDKDGNDTILKVKKLRPEYAAMKSIDEQDEVAYMPDNLEFCCPVDYIPHASGRHLTVIIICAGFFLYASIGAAVKAGL